MSLLQSSEMYKYPVIDVHCSVLMDILAFIPVYTWGTDQSSLELSDPEWTLRVGSLSVVVVPVCSLGLVELS